MLLCGQKLAVVFGRVPKMFHYGMLFRLLTSSSTASRLTYLCISSQPHSVVARPLCLTPHDRTSTATPLA